MNDTLSLILSPAPMRGFFFAGCSARHRVIVGCADLLGNGMTQMVMQQNNGNFWLYSYNAATNSPAAT